MNVKIFFIEMISKIIEKFNVNFRILRLLASVNPILMRNNSVLRRKKNGHLILNFP